ncbi:MAG: hypothetical protein HYU57_01070 [Micavibrio aeruginosavorus]|nr:hypothetical protein [Micavibrio aeruginosavorus]
MTAKPITPVEVIYNVADLITAFKDMAAANMVALAKARCEKSAMMTSVNECALKGHTENLAYLFSLQSAGASRIATTHVLSDGNSGNSPSHDFSAQRKMGLIRPL